MLEGDAEEVETGDKIMASCAFIRGGSVAVFVHATILNDESVPVGNYGIFTEQIRYPMGRKLHEICAGCVDASNNVMGVAMTELQEELGITVNTDDLLSLGSIIPSGGGTYETIELFYLHVFLFYNEVQNKIEGVFGVEGEKIRLVFIDMANMDDYLDEIGDAKADSAWRRITRRGLV